MSQPKRAERPSRPPAGPDIALVSDAPPKPADKPATAAPAPAAEDGAAVPTVTVNDPWRYLHPSRVWPD